jgi:hypothetical protein
MNEQKTPTLEELKAEQSRLTALIKIAKEARITALRKELDELLNDDSFTGETRGIPKKRKTRGLDQPVPKRLYTLKEAAMSLGISPVSVRRLVKRGILKPNRSLRTLLISDVSPASVGYLADAFFCTVGLQKRVTIFRCVQPYERDFELSRQCPREAIKQTQEVRSAHFPVSTPK